MKSFQEWYNTPRGHEVFFWLNFWCVIANIYNYFNTHSKSPLIVGVLNLLCAYWEYRALYPKKPEDQEEQ